jgi:hypothetical protein
MSRSLGSDEAHCARDRGYAVIEQPFTPEQLCERLTGLLGSPDTEAWTEPRSDGQEPIARENGAPISRGKEEA